jgi:hypothetical protein
MIAPAKNAPRNRLELLGEHDEDREQEERGPARCVGRSPSRFRLAGQPLRTLSSICPGAADVVRGPSHELGNGLVEELGLLQVPEVDRIRDYAQLGGGHARRDLPRWAEVRAVASPAGDQRRHGDLAEPAAEVDVRELAQRSEEGPLSTAAEVLGCDLLVLAPAA